MASRNNRSIRWVLLLLLFSALSRVLVAQPSVVLEIDAIESSIALAPYTLYQFEGPDSDIARIDSDNFSNFRALPSDEISFGYTSNKVWLLIATHNASDQVRNLLLDTNVKYMRPLEIYEISNRGEPILLLRNDENSVFSARGYQEPKIILPLQWQPREFKQLLLRVGAGGALSIPLELSSSVQIASKYGDARAFAMFFSGVLISLILINLFHFATVRRWEHLLYALMETSILLFVLHNEGFAFQYLWPNSPVWNAHATLVLGHSTNMFAALFALVFLELRKRAPIFAKMLLGFATVSAAALLLSPWLEPRLSNQLGLITLAVGSSTIVTAGVWALLHGHKPARYFVLGWFFMGTGAALYGLSNLAIISLPIAAIEALKFGVLLEAILISYGLSALLKLLSDKVRSSQKALITATEKRLSDALERVKLEESRAQAERELAEKALEMARTSHDIRQPIHSLRLALLAQARTQKNPATLEVFNKTLDHMEALLGNISNKEGEASRISLTSYGQLTRQLCDEFAEVANNGGIELRQLSSSLPVVTAVVSLKRVISNFLSNALKHSNASKVLFGIRRRPYGVEILVLDNGHGLDRANASTAGSGLGMGIVEALCKENGWHSEIKTQSGRGTCCSIKVYT